MLQQIHITVYQLTDSIYQHHHLAFYFIIFELVGLIWIVPKSIGLNWT